MSMNPADSRQPRPTPGPQQPLAWVLTDGTVGMRIQCLGLAKTAGLLPVIKHIHPSWLLRALPAL